MNLTEAEKEIVKDLRNLSDTSFVRKYGTTKAKSEAKLKGRSVEGTPEDRIEDAADRKKVGLSASKWEGSDADKKQDNKLAKQLHKEEVLDELSDKTLKSYINKAQDGNRKRLLNIDSAKNRKSGINKAMDKLGEDTLDELSDKTKDNYFTKAATAIGKADKEGDTKTVDKRHRGVARLLNPTVKNKGDVVREDELNELSKKTLGSYIKKSSNDLAITSARYDKAEAIRNKTNATTDYKKTAKLERRYGKRFDGINRAVEKLTSEEATLTEAKRGRPPKDSAACAVYDNAHKDEQEHIVMQLRKAALVSGHPVHFMNGDKKVLPVSHIHRALDVHDSAKPFEKQSIAHFLHHSPKTFHQVIGEEFVNESDRGMGTHSFGKEPSVSSYVKGLNSAEAQRQKSANELQKKTKHIKGGFDKPKTQYGSSTHHGNKDYSGYKVSHYSETPTMEHAASSNHGMHVTHGNSDSIGNIKKSGEHYRAATPYRYNHGDPISHDTAPKFKTLKHAIHHVITSHMEKTGTMKESIEEGKTFKDNKYGDDKQKSRELWKKISRKNKEKSQSNESIESLDELSKGMLGRYIKNARFDASSASHDVGVVNGIAQTTGTTALDRKYRDEDGRRHGKRSGGIERAVNKLVGDKYTKVMAKESINESVPSQKEAIVSLNRKTARQVLRNTKKINLNWKAGKATGSDTEDTNS